MEASSPKEKSPRRGKIKAEDTFGELLTRAVGTFIDPDNDFVRKLKENPKSVVIKLGVDPTKPDIHIGHAVIFKKLRQFQDLGAKVVFIVGDFTAMIGDPSGRSQTRQELPQNEVEKNLKTYLDQVGKIIRTDPASFSWIRNSDWYTNVTDISAAEGAVVTASTHKGGEEKAVSFDANSFAGKAILYEQTRMQVKELGLRHGIVAVTVRSLFKTLRAITHGRLIERDMFMERIQKGGELYMHEMLYPVLQAIDSSVIAAIYGSCDLEIGGTDQTFNMLMGRDVMRSNKQTAQAVMSVELLPGLDGKEKMSKSLNNYIGITESPREMYGKTMSLPDALIPKYLELATYTPLKECQKVEQSLKKGTLHPKEAKMALARQIISQYHGEQASRDAEEYFELTFKHKEVPDAADKTFLSKGENIGRHLVGEGFVSSRSEWRRLVLGSAVENLTTKEKVSDPEVVFEKPAVFRIGKKRFVSLEDK